jgi:hypothetical protein
MSWSQARSVRTGLILSALVAGLALTSAPTLAAKERSDRGRGLGRPSQTSDPQARATPAPSRSAPEPEKDRARGGPQVTAPLPLQPPRGTSEPTRHSHPLWAQPRPSRDPVSDQPGQVPFRPAPPQDNRDHPVWQTPPNQRPSPYKLFERPARDTAPREFHPPTTGVPARPTDDSRPVSDKPAPDPRMWNPRLRHGDPDQNSAPGKSVPPPANWSRVRDRDQSLERDRVRSPQPSENPVTRRPAPGGNTRLDVPRAPFRGPEADRSVKLIVPEARERAREAMRDRLRQRNREAFTTDRARPTRDAIGNHVSDNVKLVLRDNVSRISIGYQRVRRDFGTPAYHYVFGPRSPTDYWDGYWDGYADGYWAGRHHYRRSHVVLTFYYGYYWSDPYWFAFWYPGYYPSVYHYWGWCPGWIYPARVYYVPAEYVYVPVTPYRYYYGAYGIDQVGVQRTAQDIRRAWFNSEVAPLAAHLTDQLDIRVYFDGEYAYTTSTDDYYAMTVDAMATTQTVALDFNDPIWISTHEVFYTGRHVFYDPEGTRYTIHVSYRLRRLGGEWYIVAVGSSLSPIQHQYRDFRYT